MTYLYHGTTEDAIPSIARWGLRPREIGQRPSRREFRRSGLYVTTTVNHAIGWALNRLEGMRTPAAALGYSGLFVLRFDSRLVRHGMIRDVGIRGFEPEGPAWVIFDVIPPQFIQAKRLKVTDVSKWPLVETDDFGAKWRPIREFAPRPYF